MIRALTALVVVLALCVAEMARREEAAEPHTHQERIKSLADAYRASRGVAHA